MVQLQVRAVQRRYAARLEACEEVALASEVVARGRSLVVDHQAAERRVPAAEPRGARLAHADRLRRDLDGRLERRHGKAIAAGARTSATRAAALSTASRTGSSPRERAEEHTRFGSNSSFGGAGRLGLARRF